MRFFRGDKVKFKSKNDSRFEFRILRKISSQLNQTLKPLSHNNRASTSYKCSIKITNLMKINMLILIGNIF